MISALTLEDRAGTQVALLDPANGRGCVSLSGLVGTPAVRASRRVKPQRRGGLDESAYTDGALMAGEFEAWSTTPEGALSRFRSMVKPMRESLTHGGRVLRWTEGEERKALDTNLITNPSFETGTAGWATGAVAGIIAGGTLTQSSVSPFVGTSCGRVVTTATQYAGVYFSAVGTFKAGVTYTGTLRIRGSAGGENLQLLLLDSAANDVGITAVSATTSWVEYRVSITLTADRSNLYLEVRNNTAAANTYFIDAGGIFAGSNSVGYFDGDTTYAEWNETPHASSSTLYDRAPALKLRRVVKLASETDPILRGNAALLTWQAQFFAEDPRAFSQVQETYTGAALSTAGGGLTLPFTFPFTFAASGGGTLTVTNAGTDDTPPVWRIYGQALNPQIVNLDTGERLVFGKSSAATVANGSFLEVDVAAGTVRLNGDTTLPNLVNSAASTWFELPPGPSNIQMIADDFDASARLDALVRAAY